MATTLLHTNHDGSRLMRSTVHKLLEYPVWRGQRIIDLDHAKRLRDSIEDIRNLDSDYHLIVKREVHADGRIIETREVVGGQHRRSILLEEKACLRLPDFPVTYTEKDVESEAGAEAYFNKISSSKPMHFDEDPSLMVGRFLVALEKEFTPAKKSDICIKSHKTMRPFLNIEDVRTGLKEHHLERLRRTKPVDFAKRVWAWNRAKVLEMEMTIATGDVPPPMMIKCHGRNFALAYDTKLPWIASCL
jgi:hypothetical protein